MSSSRKKVAILWLIRITAEIVDFFQPVVDSERKKIDMQKMLSLVDLYAMSS